MLRPGQALGDYEVAELLGEDALASTWRIRARNEQTYVLRLLQVRLPDFQERFIRAANVLRKVRHPNLVKVSRILDVEGLPGVVTEDVNGGDLIAWIGGRANPAAEVLPFFYGLVAGVGAAHDNGLIHRNLKPTKVLVTPAGTPKVNDFALGKVTATQDGGRALTQMGTTFGTPQYMSPEQFRGAAGVDHRGDIFSLGCLLYEMLAGHRAFQDEGLMEVYTAVTDGAFDPLPPEVPPALLGLVLDMLSPDAEARPQSTQEILDRMLEDPEVAGMLPKFASQSHGPTIVAASSLSPELKSLMAAEEEAEQAALEAARKLAERKAERARRKAEKRAEKAAAAEAAAGIEPKDAAEGIEEIEEIEEIGAIEEIEETPQPPIMPLDAALDAAPRRHLSTPPISPAPLDMREYDAATIPPERAVADIGKTVSPDHFVVEEHRALRWQVAALGFIGVGLVLAIVVLVVLIFELI